MNIAYFMTCAEGVVAYPLNQAHGAAAKHSLESLCFCAQVVEASSSLRRKGFTATVSDDIALLSLCHRHTSYLALLDPTNPGHEAAARPDAPRTTAAAPAPSIAATTAAAPAPSIAATTAADPVPPIGTVPAPAPFPTNAAATAAASSPAISATTAAATAASPLSSTLLHRPQQVSPSCEAQRGKGRAERNTSTLFQHTAAPFPYPVMGEEGEGLADGGVHAGEPCLPVRAGDERGEGWHGAGREERWLPLGAGGRPTPSLPTGSAAAELRASRTCTAVAGMTEQFIGSRTDRRVEQQAAEKEWAQVAASGPATATATASVIAIASVPPRLDQKDKRLMQSACARTGE